jgi:serralysin
MTDVPTSLTFLATEASEQFVGGAGFDFVSYEAATCGVTVNMGDSSLSTGWASGDTFVSIESIIGSQFGDSLIGDNNRNVLNGVGGDDYLFGLGGDDVLIGGAGADVLDGGKCFDLASYENAHGRVVANLTRSSVNTGDAKGDTYVSIEGLVGGTGNDDLTGNNYANLLHGSDGRDFLYGLGGNDIIGGENGHDRIEGGKGSDKLSGGTGSDTFVFYGCDLNRSRDVITDFDTTEHSDNDVIRLYGIDRDCVTIKQVGDDALIYIRTHEGLSSIRVEDSHAATLHHQILFC